jgi:replication factor C subunit 3/5
MERWEGGREWVRVGKGEEDAAELVQKIPTSSTHPLSLPSSTHNHHSNKFKLVILDECDAMTKDAQFALRRGEFFFSFECEGKKRRKNENTRPPLSIPFPSHQKQKPKLQKYSSVIEKYARNARFCLICNYASKIIPALQSRCTRFRFPPLAEGAVRERVAAVAAAEALTLTPAGMDAVVTLGAGDMRRTLNILQATAMAVAGGSGSGGPAKQAGGPPTTEIDGPAVYACTGTPPPADIEAFARLLLNASFADALESVGAECAAKGYALVDIVGSLLPLVQRLAMPPRTRGGLVIALADVEAALAAGTCERLQLGAVVGAFAVAREAIVGAAV